MKLNKIKDFFDIRVTKLFIDDIDEFDFFDFLIIIFLPTFGLVIGLFCLVFSLFKNLFKSLFVK